MILLAADLKHVFVSGNDLSAKVGQLGRGDEESNSLEKGTINTVRGNGTSATRREGVDDNGQDPCWTLSEY